MSLEQRIRKTYDAFNERDETTALAGLDPEVRWDDGEGHMLIGKQAVAVHWREQWRKTDARVLIDSMEWQDGALILGVTLHVKQANGTATSQTVRNTICFSDDLIASMQIG